MMRSFDQQPSSAAIKKQAIASFVSQLAEKAEANPQVRFVVYMAEMSQYSSANPELKYTSIGKSSASELKEMLASLEFPDNLSFIFEPFDEEGDFFEHNMKTDHHWNALGIQRGLSLISKSLDSEAMKDLNYIVEVDGPPCNGSLARSGLMLLNETPVGFDCANDGITLLADGNMQTAGEHSGYYSSQKDGKIYNFYEKYYENFDEVIGIGKGSALLISDSYGNALKPALGLQFQTVSCEYLMHWRATSQIANLEESISQQDPDTILFVGELENFASFCDRFPHYFETELNSVNN